MSIVYHHLRTLRVLAAAFPDRPVLVTPNQRYSAAELLEESARVGGYLTAAGVEPGTAIAMMMCNRAEALVGFYAALALGSPPANVNSRYRAAEIAHVVNDCQAGAILFESAVADQVHAAEQLFDHPVLLVDVDGPRWSDARQHEPAPNREPVGTDRLLLYTGGTTGLPRAVEWEISEHYQSIWGMVRHDAPAPQPEQTVARGRTAPTAMPCSPFLHGVGLSLTLNTINGAGLVVFTGEASFRARTALELVERYGVAVVGIVGDAFARPILDELETGDWAGRLSSLRAISSAGAAWSSEVREAIALHLPTTKLVSNFGSSEALVTRDMTNAEPFMPERPVLIIDDDRRPVPDGAVGLLATSGHLPVGYLGEPEKSARTFPVIDGVRYALTGDEAVRESDGRIRILGRGSSVINTGGEKVWPEEVEAVIRSHVDVLDAVVVGREDERWGQRIVAVLSVRAQTDLVDDDLAALCRSSLASYKCPKDWVRLDAVPRTSVGKPDFPAIHSALDTVALLKQ